MSRKKRYISNITEEEKKLLEQGFKGGKSHQFRRRCQAILLSFTGQDVHNLSEIFLVKKQTVYEWMDRWETGGIEGLKTKAGQGKKPTLRLDNKDHVKGVEKAVEKVNKKGGNLLAEVEQELGLEKGLSRKVLRSFLKKTVIRGNGVVKSSMRSPIKKR